VSNLGYRVRVASYLKGQHLHIYGFRGRYENFTLHHYYEETYRKDLQTN